jgi:hypothetical protein
LRIKHPDAGDARPANAGCEISSRIGGRWRGRWRRGNWIECWAFARPWLGRTAWFAENGVTEIADAGFANGKLVTGEEFGDGAVGGVFLAQFTDEIFGPGEVLKPFGPGRGIFGDLLMNVVGHKNYS